MTSIGDLILGPLRCTGCGVAGPSLLCDVCHRDLPRSPIDDPVPPAARVVAAWGYEGAARALVLRLKLGRCRDAAQPLARAMAEAAARDGLAGLVVTWVPGRRGDMRVRGFDHAEVLARAAACRLGLPCRRLLSRRGNPPHQTTLGAGERHRNLEGAFAARACSSPVVLADDLVTTGGTASTCAAALLTAGAPAVEVLVPSRA